MNINNIKDAMEFVDKKLNESEEIVLESTKVGMKKLSSDIRIAFIHMIKYEIIKHRQGSDWLRSIRIPYTDCGELNSIPKTIINMTIKETDLDKLYSDCRKDARNELISKGYTHTTDISPVDRPSHFTIEFLLSKNSVEKYLRDNAYSPEVRKDMTINLTGIPLTKNQKEAMVAKYTINEAFPGIKK